MIESLIKVSYAELMCTNSNFVMLLINCEIFGVTVLMSVQYSTTKSHAYVLLMIHSVFLQHDSLM